MIREGGAMVSSKEKSWPTSAVGQFHEPESLEACNCSPVEEAAIVLSWAQSPDSDQATVIRTAGERSSKRITESSRRHRMCYREKTQAALFILKDGDEQLEECLYGSSV